MNIVVGYIRTSEGTAALERAIEEARLRHARLVIVHSSEGGPKDKADEIVAYRKELEMIDDRLTEEGVDHEIRELVRGNAPAEDLVTVAEEMKAELIVIGLRRRSPVGKLLLGSNAQDVLLQAGCAVLAVKPSGDD